MLARRPQAGQTLSTTLERSSTCCWTTDSQPHRDDISRSTTEGKVISVARSVQLPLFDGFPPPVLKRFQKSSAHNAKKQRKGRLVLAGGWIVDGDNRVLLLHRATPAMSQWETPGGKVDRGESPVDAAVRELAEELGVSVDVVDDLGWHDFESGPHRMRYALFKMKIADGEPRAVESDKFDQVRFFKLADLYDMQADLSPNARNLLTLYYQGLLDLAGATSDTGDPTPMGEAPPAALTRHRSDTRNAARGMTGKSVRDVTRDTNGDATSIVQNTFHAADLTAGVVVNVGEEERHDTRHDTDRGTDGVDTFDDADETRLA